MKKTYGIPILFLALGLPQVIFASEIESIRKQDAIFTKSDAQLQFLKRKINADTFDTIVYEQSAIIAAEDQKETTFVQLAMKKKVVQAPESYVAQLRRALMAWYGYEVTDEQKKARQNLDTLIRQKKIVHDDYDLMKIDDMLEAAQKDILKKRYAAVIARIDNEIYQQQVAIGDRWSLFKKALVVGVVAAATTVAGLVFTNTWLTSENK